MTTPRRARQPKPGIVIKPTTIQLSPELQALLDADALPMAALSQRASELQQQAQQAGAEAAERRAIVHGQVRLVLRQLGLDLESHTWTVDQEHLRILPIKS